MDFPEIKNKGYRNWGLIALRVLDQLGGSATPIDIEKAARSLPDNKLTDLQWARVVKGKYLRWAGVELKKLGYVTRTGKWELTSLGRSYVHSHVGEALVWPAVTPLDAAMAGQISAPLETVAVTEYAGYEIPILELLGTGIVPKKLLVPQVLKTLHDQLLPGDYRIINSGDPVNTYRISWCLTNLKKAGEIGNPSPGNWQITEAGRERLKREKSSWRLADFQSSKAQVRAEWTKASTAPSIPPPAPLWPTAAWKKLSSRVDPDLLKTISDRIRPDLGATPDTVRALPRNIVLYGPPGTGKTYVAKELAKALTGEAEPSLDGHWGLVQFHPSYSYEDFVQGLRPALEHTELRYRVKKGPFLQICEAAENAPDTFFVLIIDEINRGDPARIFGELLYALEYRDEPIALAVDGSLSVPPNLIVIGTMNSVDRSVALVDYALRRRFSFHRVEPEPEVIETSFPDDLDGAQAAGYALKTLNEWIEKKLNRDHLIGHSFFLSAAFSKLDEDALESIWTADIHPLLEEYFFGRADLLTEARKVWLDALKDPDAAEVVALPAS